MTKTTGKKIKGNKDDAKHFIDFYDTDFFGIVDDENKKTTSKTVSLIVPIDDDTTQKNKSNLAEHKVPQIEDFTDAEAVIKAIINVTKHLDDKSEGTFNITCSLVLPFVMPSKFGKQTKKLGISLASFFTWKSLK